MFVFIVVTAPSRVLILFCIDVLRVESEILAIVLFVAIDDDNLSSTNLARVISVPKLLDMEYISFFKSAEIILDNALIDADDLTDNDFTMSDTSVILLDNLLTLYSIALLIWLLKVVIEEDTDVDVFLISLLKSSIILFNWTLFDWISVDKLSVYSTREVSNALTLFSKVTVLKFEFV